MTTEKSALLLHRQLNELRKCGSDCFSAGLLDDSDPYIWRVTIFGPAGTFYEGGLFVAEMRFSRDYPNVPPKMRFLTDIFHPNVELDGTVCISILHPPGEDRYGYERPEERWLPIHTVETIVISVIAMLSEPNCDSPANVDAAKMFRDQPAEFRKRVGRCVRQSQENPID